MNIKITGVLLLLSLTGCTMPKSLNYPPKDYYDYSSSGYEDLYYDRSARARYNQERKICNELYEYNKRKKRQFQIQQESNRIARDQQQTREKERLFREQIERDRRSREHQRESELRREREEQRSREDWDRVNQRLGNMFDSFHSRETPPVRTHNQPQQSVRVEPVIPQYDTAVHQTYPVVEELDPIPAQPHFQQQRRHAEEQAARESLIDAQVNQTPESIDQRINMHNELLDAVRKRKERLGISDNDANNAAQ